jgi:hypothetical protein|tara:strand:- start:595 stop:846 length:252 start_codon:yes stop_codon:yes gene_type:complete
MGTVTVLDPHAEEVIVVLRALLAQCEAGNICGAIIVTEKPDGFDLDMPGTFSTDPGSIASLTGRLQMAAHSFYLMAWADPDEI